RRDSKNAGYDARKKTMVTTTMTTVEAPLVQSSPPDRMVAHVARLPPTTSSIRVRLVRSSWLHPSRSAHPGARKSAIAEVRTSTAHGAIHETPGSAWRERKIAPPKPMTAVLATAATKYQRKAMRASAARRSAA